MTVQELINKLNSIDDKSKEVSFSYDFGTNEMGDPFDVTNVTEAMDCVIIS
jgi:hypothetical protein